jgi:hypothetical protein
MVAGLQLCLMKVDVSFLNLIVQDQCIDEMNPKKAEIRNVSRYGLSDVAHTTE